MKRGCSRELYSSWKGEGKRQWWRHQQVVSTALKSLSAQEVKPILLLKSRPKQQDPLEGQNFLPFGYAAIHMILGHLFKFGSNYVGVKFAYQVSHNTLKHTQKAYDFTLKAFMFITDSLNLVLNTIPTSKTKVLQLYR